MRVVKTAPEPRLTALLVNRRYLPPADISHQKLDGVRPDINYSTAENLHDVAG
jgi:hypothetical protein